MPRPMTMAEKILAAHAGLGRSGAGPADRMRSRPRAVQRRHGPHRRQGVPQDRRRAACSTPTKIALVPDHYVPNKDIKSAEQAKIVRDFAREQGITHYYEVGCMGVEHALLAGAGRRGRGRPHHRRGQPHLHVRRAGRVRHGRGLHRRRRGLRHRASAWFKVPESLLFKIEGELAPGVTGKDVILHIIGMIGVDGALYQAMEFTGSAIRAMGMDERMSISNMAIEAGGKAGLIEVDDVTRAYLDGRTERPYTEYHSDPDAQYAKVYEIDAASIRARPCRSRTCRRTRARRPRPATCKHRPGRHRLLHERPHRRHAPGRRRAARAEGASRRALHRDPRHAGRCTASAWRRA